MSEEGMRSYEEAVERERCARETDLDYLRRTRPDMTDEARVAFLLWSAVAGTSVRREESEASS